uniref:Uncharacterized protein n=2 Tax=Cacopsylla melanoneura TaxID=428564 RepID=A0A8D9DYZ9_9HEMI
MIPQLTTSITLLSISISIIHGTTDDNENVQQIKIEAVPEGIQPAQNFSTLKPGGQSEDLFFDVDGFIHTIMKANKKNIVYKINDQLNSFYDNQTTFVHRWAGTQLQQVIESHKDVRIDKMKSYVDYFFLYKQIYMELLNGYKNIIMEGLGKKIKQDLRQKYKDKKLSYEDYIAKDEQLDEKMIFVNKAFRSGIINHVINVEVAMFNDFFQNHYAIFKEEYVVHKT